MFICELIPLKTVKTIQTLTYYSISLIKVGALVEIDMHGQKLEAIVIHNYEALDAKLILKNKDFALKKIKVVLNPEYISSELLINLKQIANNNLITINTLFNSLIKMEDLHSVNFNQIKTEQKENKKDKRKYISNLEFNNLILTEKDFVLASTEMDKIKAKDSNKTINKNIDTISLKFLTQKEIQNIFIYNSNNRNYYSNFKDVNSKNVISEICKLFNLNIYYVSDYLSLEDWLKNNETDSMNNIDESKSFSLLNMRENKNTYIHDSLLNLIKNNINQNNKILIYTNRNGLYTSSICSDCGQKVYCTNCNKDGIQSNLVLKKNKQNINFYSCNKCLMNFDLPNFDNTNEIIQDEFHNLIKCSNCNSWRIESLGIALSGIYESLNQIFKDKSIILDQETASTPNKVKKLIANFTEDKNKNILITNEYGLTLLPQNYFDLTIISSIDSLFNIPEFNIDEEIFFLTRNILSKSKTKTENFLQTRLNIKYINLFLKNKIQDVEIFYKNELEKRKLNNLSPYYQIVTFDLPDNRDTELWTPPQFLSKYQNLKLNLKTRELFNNKKINYIIRFIYSIPEDDWNSEQTSNIKDFLITNFNQFNLKLNPPKIWE